MPYEHRYAHLITTRQAARRLGVAVSTISRMVSDGRLTPALRLSNSQMLFEKADIDAAHPAVQPGEAS